MPGLFEQFPHTSLHELNMDWMIDLLNTFKQELEDRAVISVNGMTGEVTLYESENVVLPPLTEASSWRLVRMMDGQYVGVLFQDGHVWLQQGNSTLKLLTTEDIPTSAGVVSINGMGGIVTLTGRDIAIDDSPDADSIRLALETETTNRVNADNAMQNAINKVANAYKKDASTLNELKSDLLAFANTMVSREVRAYQFWASAEFSPFGAGFIYSGDVQKLGSNRFDVLFTNDSGSSIAVGYNDGTWSVNQLALKNDVGNVYDLGTISDLNISSRTGGYIYHFMFNSNTLNIPFNNSDGHGYLYVNASPNYGRQIIYSNSGIATRSLYNGTWETWSTIV